MLINKSATENSFLSVGTSSLKRLLRTRQTLSETFSCKRNIHFSFSHHRSVASPQRATQCFLFQFTLHSSFLKIILLLLASSLSSSHHFFLLSFLQKFVVEDNSHVICENQVKLTSFSLGYFSSLTLCNTPFLTRSSPSFNSIRF